MEVKNYPIALQTSAQPVQAGEALSCVAAASEPAQLDRAGVESTQLDRAALVWCPHPLTHRDRAVIFEPCRRDETLRDYLARVAPDVLTTRCILFVGDREVSPTLWHLVRVRPGIIISARALALDSGDGESDVGRTIGLIVVAVVAAYVGEYNSFYGAVVGLVGAYAVNALFPVQPPNLSKLGGASDASPTYSLSGGSNRSRPMEPVALVLGTHIMYPDFLAKPYTQIESGEEYLYMLFDWGLGLPKVTNLKIGDTPLSDYEEVEVWTERGFIPAGFPSNVDTAAGGDLRYEDGFMLRTTSENTTAISVDLSALLFRVGNEGLEGATVTIQAEYRPVGGGDDDWLPLTYQEIPGYYTHYWSRGYWVTTYEDDVTGGSAGDGDAPMDNPSVSPSEDGTFDSPSYGV